MITIKEFDVCFMVLMKCRKVTEESSVKTLDFENLICKLIFMKIQFAAFTVADFPLGLPRVGRQF